MNLAWKVSLPHADKLVRLALADNANDEGLCWPRVQTLTEKCGMDERTVQRVIQRLQTAGHVTITPRAGRSNYYTVHPRRRATPAESHHPPGTAPPHPRRSATQNLQGTIRGTWGGARCARRHRPA